MSAIIFVALAVAWAVYLIPKALQHHDEIARTRSIDRFSTAMRVLARREPVNRRDSRLVVIPARPGTRMLVPTQSVAAVAAVVASSEAPTTEDVRRPRPGLQRAAARAAARRRRHLLMFLVLAAVVVSGVATFGYLPWWSVSIPGGLVPAYLILCRHQVRRDHRAAGSPGSAPAVPADAASASTTAGHAVRVEAPHGTPRSAADEDTIALSSAALEAALSAATVEEADEAAAVAVQTSVGGSLWDPVPMTLPTYVTKPRAARTVRTIDLSEPNTWSSGRSEADSKLVEETDAAREEAAKAAEQQRAVGS